MRLSMDDLHLQNCSTYRGGKIDEELWRLDLFRTTRSEAKELRKWLCSCIEKAELYDKLVDRIAEAEERRK